MKIRRNAAPRGRAAQTAACLGIAAICSMALWVSGGPALASPEQDSLVVGDASAIEAGVEVRGGADAPFVLLEAVEPVAVGDGVRTDTTGFAEIAYFDGSRTRLDIDTEFDVVELVNDAGVSSTRTSMGVGRTWHRVESLGEGEFTVETSQATATVRGTAFVLACAADSCTYIVFEGVIELTLADGSVVEVIGPAEVEVVGGVAGPVTPVTLDRLLGDPWLLDNANRDIAAGFGDLVAILGTTEVTTTAAPLTTSTTTADTSHDDDGAFDDRVVHLDDLDGRGDGFDNHNVRVDDIDNRADDFDVHDDDGDADLTDVVHHHHHHHHHQHDAARQRRRRRRRQRQPRPRPRPRRSPIGSRYRSAIGSKAKARHRQRLRLPRRWGRGSRGPPSGA